MKRIVIIIGVLLSAVAVMANDGPKSITLTQEEKLLVQRNNDFAFNLMRKARKEAEGMLLSPLSITYALGMVNNGAAPDSQTRKEINQVLGADDSGAEVLNAFCLKMLTESGTLDELTKVSVANNIYMNSYRGCHLSGDFVQKAVQYYNAQPEDLDFTDPAALTTINQWAKDHTEGMIDKVLDESEFDPQCISYLLNALYFNGQWTSKFNPEHTYPLYFENGNDHMCWMMMQQNHFSYYENDTYKSIILPYGNMSYQMTVFLPQWNKNINDVLNSLSGENWQKLQMYYDECDVDLWLPRIETETDMKLNEIMAALGMPTAFTDECAFTQFCEDPDGTPHPVYIDMMKQVAKIKLNEEGTEASAVTVVGMKDGAVQNKSFHARAPFLYIISEQSTGTIFFIGQYMGEVIDNYRRDIKLTPEEKQLVQRNNDFAFNLMRKTRRDGEGLVLSPLSITYALSMLNNGATGQTQQEINNVLGFGDAGMDAVNDFCRKILTESEKLDKGTKVKLADAIYVNNGYELNPDFVQKAHDYYDATVESRDFHDGVTMDVINQWARNHTEGAIEKILDETSFSPDAASYLLNAVYFKGGWVLEFDETNTKDELFSDGTTVPMMHQRQDFVYGENDTYQFIELPYGNEAYEMCIFLPREDKSIADVLAMLDGKGWYSQFGQSYGLYDVDLKLPRFKTTTTQDLNDILSELGMPTAFDSELAEFPNFCTTPTYIDFIKQSATINVNEKGTEAAAVTIMGMMGSAMPGDRVDFHATRPFLYLIRETSTGVIFFIGQYAGEKLQASMSAPTIDNALQTTEEYYTLDGRRMTGQPTKGIYIQNGRKVVIK